MKIQINGFLPKIGFNLDLKNLKDADDESLLALGTLYDPIPADFFINKTKTEIPTFYKNEKITVQWDPDYGGIEGMTVKVICCKIKNIGRKFNESIDEIENPWQQVFTLPHGSVTTPDGLLYLIPTSPNSNGTTAFELDVQDDPKEDTYMSYNIIFSITYTSKEGSVRRQYFVIDPLLKVSSGVPPHS